MTGRTISSAWVKGIQATLVRAGLDPDVIFKEAGLNLDEAGGQDARFAPEKISLVWEIAVRRSGNPALGLGVPEEATPIGFDAVAYVMMSCPNLLAALERLIRYTRIISSAADLALVKENGGHAIQVGLAAGDRPVPRQRVEFVLVMLLNFSRRITGRRLRPLQVDLANPAPGEVGPYQDAFDCPIRFDAPVHRMVFSDADLGAPLPTSNAALAELHDRHAVECLNRLAEGKVSYQTRELIIRLLPDGDPSRAEIARTLCMSERTLQRRLQDEGTSFHDLLDGTRKELAQQYLRQPDLTLAQVAYLLGFGDQSTFSRACKRWFDQWAGEYRDALVAGPKSTTAAPAPASTPARHDILVTKLSGPGTSSDLVPRPRLAPQFDRQPFNGLTLVCAPAGYGKTTLVSAWGAASPVPVAWLSVDNGDNDPVRFLAHMVAAVQTRCDGFGGDLGALLGSPNPPPVTLAMTRLVNALAALPRKMILVLDDYHAVTETAVHDAMQFLINHQPDNLHVVIASREEPPFSTARLLSHGRLLRFMERDLSFTSEEAEQFFNQTMQLELSGPQIKALIGRTEGWAAGLRMAALSMAHGQDRGRFISNFSGQDRNVIDFLVDEVLTNQSVATQSFLMHTAILERFNAELCDVITGRSDSRAVLDELERNHLFLVSLEPTHSWYRYHHLFADLLRSRLDRMDSGQAKVLHRRAAAWYIERRHPSDAFHHARLAGDAQLFAGIIDRFAMDLLSRGSVKTVRDWMRYLQPDALLHYPRIALLVAFNTYFQAKPDVQLAERCLAEVEKALAGMPESAEDYLDLQGKAAVVRGYQARYSGRVELALACFTKASEVLQRNDMFHVTAMINLAILHFSTGRMDEAAAISGRYAAVRDDQPNLWIAATGFFGLARFDFMRGRLAASHAACMKGVGNFAEKGLQDLPVCSMLHLQMAEIAWRQNDLDEATMQATRASMLAAAGGMELFRACSEVLLARIRLARGGSEGLDAVYERNLLEFWALVYPVIPPLSGWLSELWLMQGRIRDLDEWFAQRGINAQTPWPGLETEHLVLARILLQKHRTAEAFDLLNRLFVQAEKEHRITSMIDIMVQQVLVRQAEDKLKPATAVLCQALDLARQGGALRPFIDAGTGMRALLAKAEVPDELRRFADRILAACEGDAGVEARAEPAAAVLSNKEERIARLLVAGLSNDEIAERLFVSPNTVKFHVKALYRKLGVNKRFDAIRKLINQ
ncbi:MAG TPA: AraC family transcriptional regulator ligand-binding domain-containing protein [Noviherbaspirillum sp.]|nr:AraC family transcriptional regulator ligand-binding domain-containing protein [Noviherbaspirillum sp.]